ADEARTGDRRRAERRRVLDVPAAPLAWQHDRGGHERDPAQHRRPAGARAASGAPMGFSFTSEQEGLRREARPFLRANPAPSEEMLEQLGWVGVVESESFLEAAVLFEELGRVLYDGPYIANEVGEDRQRRLAANALEAVGIGSRAVELAIAYVAERE